MLGTLVLANVFGNEQMFSTRKTGIVTRTWSSANFVLPFNICCLASCSFLKYTLITHSVFNPVESASCYTALSKVYTMICLKRFLRNVCHFEDGTV